MENLMKPAGTHLELSRRSHDPSLLSVFVHVLWGTQTMDFLWNDWSLLLLIEHHGKMMYLICHDFNWTPWSFSKNDWSLKKNVCLLLDKHRSVVGDVSCWSTHIQPMRFQPMMSQLCVGWKMFKRLRLWINQAHGHVYPMRHFHYIIILS